MQADDVGPHDPQRVAKQILAMYGKHIAERSSKSKKAPKKNKDLHEVKVSTLESLIMACICLGLHLHSSVMLKCSQLSAMSNASTQ